MFKLSIQTTLSASPIKAASMLFISHRFPPFAAGGSGAPRPVGTVASPLSFVTAVLGGTSNMLVKSLIFIKSFFNSTKQTTCK